MDKNSHSCPHTARVKTALESGHKVPAGETEWYETATYILSRIEELQAQQEMVMLRGSSSELRLIITDEYICIRVVRDIVSQHPEIQFSTAHACCEGHVEITVTFGQHVSEWLHTVVNTHETVSVA